MVEGLDQVIVRNITAESLRKLGEVLGETKSHLPGLVLTGVKNGAKGVDAVLLLAEVAGHWDEGLDAEHAAGILVVLRQLSENW